MAAVQEGVRLEDVYQWWRNNREQIQAKYDIILPEIQFNENISTDNVCDYLKALNKALPLLKYSALPHQ